MSMSCYDRQPAMIFATSCTLGKGLRRAASMNCLVDLVSFGNANPMTTLCEMRRSSIASLTTSKPTRTKPASKWRPFPSCKPRNRKLKTCATVTCACRSNRRAKAGRRIPTHSTHGSRPGCGRMKRWTRKREGNFIQLRCS